MLNPAKLDTDLYSTLSLAIRDRRDKAHERLAVARERQDPGMTRYWAIEAYNSSRLLSLLWDKED